MSDVFLLASATTPFGRHPDTTHLALARDVVAAVLQDAGLDDGGRVDGVWFGSCALHAFGQSNIRGQAVLAPLVREGRLAASAPIVNVEAGCATGGVALHGAFTSVASGDSELALALGVEKTFIPTNPKQMLELFEGGLNQLEAEQWKQLYASLAPECGTTFAPRPDRITILDVAALNAHWHMKTYGTRPEDLAQVSSKNHANGALNPRAHYREPMSPAQVLADKVALMPFTRSMCAPISDGAAAALVCSARFLRTLPAAAQARAVKLTAVSLTNGARQRPDAPSVAARAGERLWKRLGFGPETVDVAEVHDATAFSELATLEALGFCAPGKAAAYSASGATARDGEKPINTSGGLESKGHPLAASGLAMVAELHAQLRGEAGPRQVKKPVRTALAHNAGGLIGFDEAMCALTVLQQA
ncbi:MAG: thiolase family protein [Myxococcaceae bacterium]|nr:thiolase family protein [Myxococcaceae bacterium]